MEEVIISGVNKRRGNCMAEIEVTVGSGHG